MKVIDPGHVYELDSLDNFEGQPPINLVFVKREGPGYPSNVGHHYGTNIQEVLRACIDRVKYLDNQVHSRYNGHVLENLRQAILHLELRAANRHGRSADSILEKYEDCRTEIETEPTCNKCGHIGCQEECHGTVQAREAVS